MEHRCLAHTRHFPGRLDTLNKCPLRNKWTLVEHILPVKMGTPDAYGPHNELQRAIIDEFLPRYAIGAQVLYIGDTENKSLVVDAEGLIKIGLPPPERGDRLPDIVAYEPERNWVFLIEAVHSSNPIDDARRALLTRLTTGCTAGKVFVTAFLTRADFRKWVKGIAWETEVWIAESPDHMIHFNGDRFLGPYELPEDS